MDNVTTNRNASTNEKWVEISKQYYLKTNQNCLGAINGKHIRGKNPNNSGLNLYNYKKYFSIILIAVVDSNLCFTAIDVGAKKAI